MTLSEAIFAGIARAWSRLFGTERRVRRNQRFHRADLRRVLGRG